MWLLAALACSQPAPADPEVAALRYAESRAPADREVARRMLAEAIARDPAWTYLHFLDAWTGGGTPPDGEGWYRYWFERADAADYVRCHAVQACLERRGEAIPGFLRRDGEAPTPVRCDDLEISACPADYSLFEQMALRSRGSDRLDQWRGAPMSFEEFSAQIGLRPGMRVADVGSGEDWFAVRMARVVGEAGVVYAVDIDPHVAPLTTFLATFYALPNLRPVVSTPGDVALDAVDFVWICDVLKVFHREDRRAGGKDVPAFLDSIARALMPGGTLVIAEKRDGPEERDPVDLDALAATVGTHGFSLEETLADYLPKRVVMRFRR